MANPFLMTDDDIVDMTPATNSVAFNPFLAQDGDGDNEFTDNPFVGGALNPFAGFGDDSAAVPVSTAPQNTTSHSDAAMSFFGTTIQDDDLSVSEQKLPNPLANFEDPISGYSSEDELARKKAPPRPLPPSQTTQDLIFAVADQLDQASSQMLGRLPKTRSPSPVSMRDMHSPSPTPDTALGDFLDCSDQPLQPSSMFEENLMATSSENPFAMPAASAMEVSQPVVKQPPRPPPPRPVPPRPTPPVMVPPATTQTVIAPPNPVQQVPSSVVQNQEPDLFDMFDAPPSLPPKPPAPKSKEDILSLFNNPKPQAQPQQVQPDLLSGDILEDIPANDFALPPLNEPIIPPVSRGSMSATEETGIFPVADNGGFTAIPEPTLAAEQILPASEIQPTISEPEKGVIHEGGLDLSLQNNEAENLEIITDPQVVEEPQQLIMDSITPDVSYKRAPTPDIEITTVESLPRSDDEEEPLEKDIDSSVEMEESKSIVADDSDQSHAFESTTTTQALQGSPPETHIAEPITEQEQMDTGLDFAPSIPSGSASANPFASPETEDIYPKISSQQITNIFAVEEPITQPSPFTEPFAIPVAAIPQPSTPMPNIFAMDDGLAETVKRADDFDAFSAKFDSATKEVALIEGFGGTTPVATDDAWGAGESFGTLVTTEISKGDDGFGLEDESDSFLSMQAPEKTRMIRNESADSFNDEKEFNVVIRPKGEVAQSQGQVLVPPPPPRSSQNNSIYSGDSSPRFNPFDKSDEVASAEGIPGIPEPAAMQRTDSQETPTTPLFDDDVSQPLEDFPRINYTGSGWEMQLRQPNKKKITGQRFWKKVFVKIVSQGDNAVAQLYNQATDKEPFQELPLQPCYSVSDIGAQQYDQFGKIFTVKLQYIFYKERPGVRPGQVTKAERLTNKLSQFAAYAIQGDYQGVKEFGSDLKKLGLPVEHAPQVSQLFKIGSMSYEDMKQFSVCVEEALFKLPAHRDRALNYKSEEVQITAVDELYVEQDAEGHVHKQIARVRLFFLGFLSGMPWIELGVNDLWRQGKEVVGRHDIIPVVTEEWIRLEGVEFHNTVQLDEYERSRIIKFQPPDACYIELMRFRVRPPKNRELPLQVKATWVVTGNRVELRADVLVPGFASRKLGQIPCEDVSIRFPIPECWIYLFRVEKHFRYGSVKSAHRRTGKIKGIERILGTVDTLQESLIEVTSGQAKYEHHHRAIVWRCPRLPKEGQGAYTTHQMVCRMALTSYDQIPEQLAPYCYVEFTMPATQVSHTTVRSVSVQESDSDEPPEKYVRYLARHEYRVGIEHTTGESENPYLSATRTTIKEEAPPPQAATSPMAPSDSDSESN